MKDCCSRNFEILKDKVIEASSSNSWMVAKTEWDVIDVYVAEDEEDFESCQCSHYPIKEQYTISNRITHKTLCPIGNVCIHMFEEENLSDKVDFLSWMIGIGKKLQAGENIEFCSPYFSRKALLGLLRAGAFVPTKYNHYDGDNDYTFLLRMFNKRSCTSKQSKKISALLYYTIIPFVRKFYRESREKH